MDFIRKTIDQLDRISAEQVNSNTDLLLIYCSAAEAGRRSRSIGLSELRSLILGLELAEIVNAAAAAGAGWVLRKKLDGTGLEFAEISTGSGPGSSGTIEVPFAYGDATPKTIAIVSRTVFTAQIVITVPFNGVGASLALGDAIQPSRLIATHQVDPYQVCEYEANPGVTYSEATPILLSIIPGAGCTQGAGFVLLEI